MARRQVLLARMEKAKAFVDALAEKLAEIEMVSEEVEDAEVSGDGRGRGRARIFAHADAEPAAPCQLPDTSFYLPFGSAKSSFSTLRKC